MLRMFYEYSVTIFTARRSYVSAVFGVVILSVRLSLSVTRVLYDKPNNALQIF